MSQDTATDALLAEYAQMREELRLTLNSMDTSLRTMILLAAGLVTVAATLRDERVIFLLPTVIFLFGFGHFLRATSANILGTYCQVIAERLKTRLGSQNVMMNWEGSKLWRNSAHPSGIVQIGFYLVFLAMLGIFVAVAYRAYLFWKPSLAVHLIEIILLIVYSIYAMRWNTIRFREKWVHEMLAGASNQGVECTGGPLRGSPSAHP